MPAAHDPVPSRSEKAATGIYIARGADTLGPYDPAEAAALVVGGYLHADDHAARNGDAAWVPLAEFLPPSLRPSPGLPSGPAAPALPVPRAAPSRRRWPAGLLLIVAMVGATAGFLRWREANRESKFTAASAPVPAVATPAPAPVPTPTLEAVPAVVPTLTAPPPVAETPPPPPTPEPDGPLHGSLVLGAASGDHPASPEGTRVRAYPLAALEDSLAPAVAAARAARDRFDPQIEAADAEHARRLADEQAALKALNEAAPSDPLRRSLRFAYNGARTATRTAADNQRFLRQERTAAAGADVFFRALPAPSLSAVADSDGSFVLDLPADGQPYAVAAEAPPPTDDSGVRPRRWIVRLSPAQRAGHEPLRLDEGNTLTSAADASLVHAAD